MVDSPTHSLAYVRCIVLRPNSRVNQYSVSWQRPRLKPTTLLIDEYGMHYDVPTISLEGEDCGNNNDNDDNKGYRGRDREEAAAAWLVSCCGGARFRGADGGALLAFARRPRPYGLAG